MLACARFLIDWRQQLPGDPVVRPTELLSDLRITRDPSGLRQVTASRWMRWVAPWLAMAKCGCIVVCGGHVEDTASSVWRSWPASPTAMSFAVIPSLCPYRPTALEENGMTATYTFDIFSTLDG